MTDATITDLTTYRLQKASFDFNRWIDKRFLTRLTLLEQIEEKGIEALGDPETQVFRMAFPNGYDPINHPDDNINVVRAEGIRRGVIPSQ